MAINNNITREDFTQSQIFKNILCAGMSMASFIDKAELGDAQKESAEKLVQSWRTACRDFANDDEKTWEEAQHNEIIEDVTEYLAKAKAMTEMALDADLEKISAETLHGYFWTLLSLINVNNG
jgi:hypothetical protein